MLPQYQQLGNNYYIRIPFGRFSFGIVALPFFGFIFCILWSLIFVFNESTGTHCAVQNWLPSISAAIGNYQPQRFVWQITILLHAIPRLMISYQYFWYYNEVIRINRRPIAYTACLFNVIENLALVGLSLWTSLRDYEVHKTCFITFVITSECYMMMSYFLLKNCRKVLDKLTDVELKSLRFKRNLFITNVISFSFAGYFFLRHNERCETGIYTLFALMEYIVVLTNMGFHMTSYWDFYDRFVIIDAKHGAYITRRIMM